MSDSMSSDDIERDIEVERVALARSLDELQRQISPEALVNRFSGILRENGGEVAQSALRQARDNPVALAVTGAGLAWLMVGPARKTHEPRPRSVSVPKPRRPQPRDTVDYGVATGIEDVSTRRSAPEPRVSYDDRTYPKATGFRSSPDTETFESRVARAEGRAYDPSIRAPSSSRGSSRIVTKSDMGDDSLLNRLLEGTEKMTDAARDRVIAAREAAIDAERRLEARARDYGVAGRDAYYSQPLIGALVAFGVGALAGALVPRTRVEDRHLGPARDRAMLEAERIYRSEAANLRAQAESFAEDTLDSAKSAIRSTTSDDGSSNSVS